MSLIHRSLVLILLVGTLTTSFAAAATLDTPSLALTSSGRTSLRVLVSAGVSGAPEGFRMQWMPASSFDLAGGWPATVDSRLAQGDFTGVPTLNTTDGTREFKLLAREQASVQVGDLFDETGVLAAGLTDLNELQSDQVYVIRVQAIGGASDSQSPWSQSFRVTTTASQNCTFTQGYWKNHPSVWPTTSLKIGNVTYTQAQILQVYNQPAAGNGLISLFHQLSATKLNIAQGAVAPPAVQTAITNADALIGNLVAPPIGSGSLSPGSTSALTQTLDDFNNGVTGPGHCGTVPTKTPTWGALKLQYR